MGGSYCSIALDSQDHVYISAVGSGGGGTGLTTAAMTLQATFASEGWDFDSVWTIKEGCTYPYLQQLICPFAECVYGGGG